MRDVPEHDATSTGWLRIAAVVGALAVALGAFGAHGLENVPGMTSERIGWWETGARYHLVQATALLVVVLAFPHARWTPRLWVFGIAVFGGTLYGMALGGPRWLGAITPLGGAALIAGWLALWPRRPAATRPNGSP